MTYNVVEGQETIIIVETDVEGQETTKIQTENNNLDSKLVKYSFKTTCKYQKSDRSADCTGICDYSRSDYGCAISMSSVGIMFGVIITIGLIIVAIVIGSENWIVTIMVVLTGILLNICMIMICRCCQNMYLYEYEIVFNESIQQIEIYETHLNKTKMKQSIKYDEFAQLWMEESEDKRLPPPYKVGVVSVVTVKGSHIRINKYYVSGHRMSRTKGLITKANHYWTVGRFNEQIKRMN
eukprot:380119_1